MPHPLDTQIIRKDVEYIPLPTLHSTRCQEFPCTLVVEIEIYKCYVALDFIKHLKLKLEPHPEPHYLKGYFLVRHQCRVLLQIGSYEDEIVCDVLDIKKTDVILG